MLTAMGLVIGFFLGILLYKITRHECEWTTITDCEACRIYHKCRSCGKEAQSAVVAEMNGKRDWVVFQHGENQCKFCLCWKPVAWKFCSISYCKLNPDGPVRRTPF